MVFESEFDALDDFSTIQQDGYNSGPGGYDESYSAEVVDDGPGHETALRFEVRPGDVPEFGGGERSEVRVGDEGDVREGDRRVYRFHLKFDDGFTPPDFGWFIVMQWHAGDGSPPLALQVNRDGELELSNNRTGADTTIGPVRPGEWVDYRIDAVFGDGSDAVAEVWEDGEQVATHRHPNMASESSYLKLGIYRDRDDDAAAVLYDNFTVSDPS